MAADWDRKEFLIAILRMERPHSVHARLQLEGLTQGEFMMLNMLNEHGQRFPENKGMYVSELAELLQVSPPAVSRMLRGLEHKGYIQRVVDRENRRMTYIVLRPEGVSVRRRVEERALSFAERVAERLGSEDTATLIGLWSRLNEIIQEERTKGI